MDEHLHRRLEIMRAALPSMPPTPTHISCRVEMLAKEVVARGECRRTAACALCTLSGLSCEQIMTMANEQIHQ